MALLLIIFDFILYSVKLWYSFCNKFCMFKAFQFRLYPTNCQKELISKHIGSSRFIYNLALETKTTAYLGNAVNLSRYDLQKQMVDLKKECEWLKEVNSQSLQVALLNLDAAYSKFFKGAGFPKYKSKHKGKQSFSVPQNVILKDDLLIIPFIGLWATILTPTLKLGIISKSSLSITLWVTENDCFPVCFDLYFGTPAPLKNFEY